MAIVLNLDDGTLIIPGAYASYQVQASVSGVSATGIMALIGEADAGPRFSLETDLQAGAFGPSQLAAVVSKYKSGPLVDAVSFAAAPSNDPQINGSVGRIILLKTNASTRALSSLTTYGDLAYGQLRDRSYGKLGNLIYYRVTAQAAEQLPSTGAWTYIPAVGTVEYSLRASGGASVGGTLSANTQPAALVSALDALAGISASGGVNRNVLTVSGTLLVDANPGGAGANVVDVTRSIAWAVTPVVGDTLIIPTGSAVAGSGNANVGAYVITAVTSTNIRAVKLSDAGRAGAVAGTITAPVDVSPAVSIVANTDISCHSPVTVSLEAGNPIAGVGKSLEFNQLTAGTDLLERTAYQLGTTSQVTWVSKSGSAKVLSAGAEYKALLTVSREIDAIQEEIRVGGDVALTLGYSGTTATVTVTGTQLTTSVSGGSGANLSLTLSDFPTIADLAAFIGSQTGYLASVGTATLGQLPATAIDDVTAANIATTHGARTGRLKIDAYRWFTDINSQSVLVQVPVSAGSGLPQPMAQVAYLSGGSRGGSSDADFQEALAACEKLKVNFVIPLISRDASLDIADGLTDAASTYTVDAVNAQVRAHVSKMSTLKRRRNRQGFISKATDFAAARAAAANVASFRCAFAFQDQRLPAANGTLRQFLPWSGAVLAASMQAAAGPRPVFNKLINTGGALMRDGSFSDLDDVQVEDALLAGLLVARRLSTGGWTWVSDSTTYGRDSNFVFNSFQAVYAADVLSLETAESMERLFTGQATADISANLALAAFETKMLDWLRRRYTAPSVGAPNGYRNARVDIQAPVMTVTAEVFLSTGLYFIPIRFNIQPASSQARQ